jgi:hypothetical protein
MRQRDYFLKSSMSGRVSGFLIAGLLLVGGTVFAQEKPAVVPDAQIEANVLKALADVPQLADQAISTTTVYGEVTLSGTVRDEASRDMAEKVAADAPGVKKVVDQLAIGTAEAAETSPAPDQAQDQGESAGDNGPVLQSDGTYTQGANTQQPDAQENQQQNQQQGDMRATPGPPPGQSRPNGPYRRPYGPPYGQQRAENMRPYVEQMGGQSVVVPSGTLLRVRINEGMDSKNTAPGTMFDGVVLSDVIAGNAVAIPRGTAVQGNVVDAHNAGALKGKGQLALELTQITLGGQTYSVVSDAWTHQGADKTGQTVGNAVGLGAVGAMIGAVAGGGPGALLGAGIGGAAGVGTSAATKRGEAMIPAEAILTFHLTRELPLMTVSQAEMNRLASGVQASTPQLGRRYPPPPPPYYGPAY